MSRDIRGALGKTFGVLETPKVGLAVSGDTHLDLKPSGSGRPQRLEIYSEAECEAC